MINIKVKNFEISNSNQFCVITGPCVIESKDHTLKIASIINETCREVGINYVFKSSFG